VNLYDEALKALMNEKLEKLEKAFDADVLFFYGEIQSSVVRAFRDLIEDLKKPATPPVPPQTRLVIILNTSGGSAETVEKLVDIIRHHYDDVSFVVPDFAMSAGTIFCMSGNRIYMDYSSSLGPIDPQVWNGKQWVPSRGYLDKVQDMLDRATTGNLSNAEFLILQNQDLGMLSRYEQATNLTETLLKKWLIEYKWKNWVTHETTPAKIGQPVTNEEKLARAEEVAKELGNNQYWHTHSRMIGIDTLRNHLKLKIEDYSKDPKLQPAIRSYNDLITEWIAKTDQKIFVHTRRFF
jgi:membrane-bound ClpP family serine protease